MPSYWPCQLDGSWRRHLEQASVTLKPEAMRDQSDEWVKHRTTNMGNPFSCPEPPISNEVINNWDERQPVAMTEHQEPHLSAENASH
jgi:hypothetical protein